VRRPPLEIEWSVKLLRRSQPADGGPLTNWLSLEEGGALVKRPVPDDRDELPDRDR
jgi:hypothetical protein